MRFILFYFKENNGWLKKKKRNDIFNYSLKCGASNTIYSLRFDVALCSVFQKLRLPFRN